MQIEFTLIICLLISVLSVWAARKLRLSVTVALTITGILIGSPLLRNIILGPNIDFVIFLGNVGLVSLMFLAGMEVSWSMMYNERKDSVIIAAFATFVPMILGFVIFLGMGYSILTSLTVGICLCITAEATKARELMELKKLKTKLGSLLLGAGITDDLIGILAFIFVCYLFTGTIISEELIIFLTAIFMFGAGILVHKFFGREREIIMSFEKLLLMFITPFFFISMGINFNLQSSTINFLLLIPVILIAIIGKISGVLLTRSFIKLKLKQLYLIGWGMNSRGAVELAIVFIAFKIGLLTPDLYSSLVIMTLITTLIFPFTIRELIREYPNIMDE